MTPDPAGLLAGMFGNNQNSTSPRFEECISKLDDALRQVGAIDHVYQGVANDGKHDLDQLPQLLRTIFALANSDAHLLAPLPYRWRFKKVLAEIGEQSQQSLSLLAKRTDGQVLDPNLKQRLDQLESATGQLGRLRNRVRLFVSWCSIASLLTALLLLAVLATLYLNSLEGMTLNSKSILFPRGPFSDSTDSDVLSAIPADLHDYFQIFSQYYFLRNRDDHKDLPFASRYSFKWSDFGRIEKPGTAVLSAMDDPVKLAREVEFGQRWKVELQNESFFYSTFLSTVELRLELITPREFPWRRLVTNPKLQIAFAPALVSTPGWAHIVSGKRELPDSEYLPTISIQNYGLGPAIDVECTVTASSGLPIVERRFDEVHEREEVVQYASHAIGGKFEAATRRIKLESRDVFQQIDERSQDGFKRTTIKSTFPSPVSEDESPLLSDPLFFLLPEGMPLNDLGKTIDHDGKQYEVVENLRQLKRITQVAWNEPATARIRYRALNGQRYCEQRSFDLPQWLVYYQPCPELLWYDPRNGPPLHPETKTREYTVAHMVPILAKPNIIPYGDELIILEYTMRVGDNVEGALHQQLANVNSFLKPQGRLVAEVNVLYPRSGRYQASVVINGEVRGQFMVDVISPERFRYEESSFDTDRLKLVLSNQGTVIP